MKIILEYDKLSPVVPHAGTWIEIPQRSTKNGSAPVVPHAGTWIEISMIPKFKWSQLVVPHAGTWIEMLAH